MNQLEQIIAGLVGSTWVATCIIAASIIVVTAVCSRLTKHFMDKFLHFNEQKDLPSSSIFVNIARAGVWVLGVCIMLSTCFHVDVSAAIAALGIGGIALSLGFQDTIANLIGGLQVSLMRIIKPGDHIEVGVSSGVVTDITWRHTTICNSAGEEVIIPNSIINKTALVHLPPTNQVKIPIVVVADAERLNDVAYAIELAGAKAVSGVARLTKQPVVSFSAIVNTGVQGSITFSVADGLTAARAGDAVLRAVAPLAQSGVSLEDVEGVEEDPPESPEALHDERKSSNTRHQPPAKSKQITRSSLRKRMARALRIKKGEQS